MRRSETRRPETRRSLLGAFAATAALIVGGALAGESPPTERMPCPWDPGFVSVSVAPRPASAFAGIDRRMTLRQIVAALGPARADVGSGLHVLQWPVDDGRWFSVSAPDACSEPLAAHFLPASTKRPLGTTPKR